MTTCGCVCHHFPDGAAYPCCDDCRHKTIVIRGSKLYEGRWYDVDFGQYPVARPQLPDVVGVTFGPTGEWERCKDGGWAQVYRPVEEQAEDDMDISNS